MLKQFLCIHKPNLKLKFLSQGDFDLALGLI